MYAVNQYDAVAESYDSLFKDKASIEENRKIASMLFEVSGIFLDVGCGTGLLLDILKVSPDEYWVLTQVVRCLMFSERSIRSIIICVFRLSCSI